MIPNYNLQPPNALGKDVANVDTLLVLLTFNIQYDTSIFPLEGHRVQLPGCYLSLAFTGGRPAKFVDREKRSDDDECLKELFSYISTRSTSSDEDKAPDEHSRLLEEMISQEYKDRGRPKALCYEDIQLMVVRHPETGEEGLAMAICISHRRRGASCGRMEGYAGPAWQVTPVRRVRLPNVRPGMSWAVIWTDQVHLTDPPTLSRNKSVKRQHGRVSCS